MVSNLHTISTSPEFSQWAKDFSLSWSEAGRVGMALLLSECGAIHTSERIDERVTSVLQDKLVFKKLHSSIEKLTELLHNAQDELERRENVKSN